MVDVKELKPCPFCGGNDLYYDNSDDRSGGEWIGCNTCEFEFRVPYGGNRKENQIDAKWNRREKDRAGVVD